MDSGCPALLSVSHGALGSWGSLWSGHRVIGYAAQVSPYLETLRTILPQPLLSSSPYSLSWISGIMATWALTRT